MERSIPQNHIITGSAPTLHPQATAGPPSSHRLVSEEASRRWYPRGGQTHIALPMPHPDPTQSTRYSSLGRPACCILPQAFACLCDILVECGVSWQTRDARYPDDVRTHFRCEFGPFPIKAFPRNVAQQLAQSVRYTQQSGAPRRWCSLFDPLPSQPLPDPSIFYSSRATAALSEQTSAPILLHPIGQLPRGGPLTSSPAQMGHEQRR